MSSHAKRSKPFSCCAIMLAGLLLNTMMPGLAAGDSDLDNWIKESGSETQTKAPESVTAKKEITELSQSDEAAGEKNSIPAKKIAQVLPASVTSAVNGAVPGAAAAPLLRGGVTYCVPSGTPLKLKLATVPMPELKSEIKDMEGHLLPAQMDQIITAKITEDIYVDDNKVIPEGTVFHGKVSKIYPPRHVGRPGHLELSFDRFTTPDGRSFAFRAEADNYKESTVKSKAQGAGIIAAHAAGGAAVGVLVAYKLFGLQNTIAMHGYNIAGGAAVGAVGGIAWALWRRGDQAVLEPGDEFAMSIDKDLLIPAASNPTPKAPPASIPGFDLEVISKKSIKDGFGGHMLRLEAMITNHSRKKMNSIDLFLQDDLGNKYPVSPDVDEDAQELFYIQPLSRQRIVCTFAVEYPKLKHKLVWLDHNDHSIIFEQKL